MLDKLRSFGVTIKREISYYRLLIKDRRTPKAAKILLWVALGYLLMPIDLIPDFIPVLGHLDDLVIIPLLVVLALRMIPEEAKRDCRASVTAS
ncbi:MAG TPA: hypothetical protein DEO84_03370 [candidate division Zixibacteria bacterium]|nr:hypothetical protein [candidate division Zixibacteria bacterium]HBZ00342.1 hypothetical protein [candidate division Zixibacteria bacterium]